MPCSVCGAPLYWYADHVWRQFLEETRHTCGGYYAQHRAEHPEDYMPLHELVNNIPEAEPRNWRTGLRRGTKRW